MALVAVAAVAVTALAAPASASAAARAGGPAPGVPDLVVTSPDVLAGTAIEVLHGVTIGNIGGDATGVVVDIVVPPGLAVRSATHGWFAQPCTVTASAVRCTLGRVVAGSERFVSLRTELLAGGPHQLQVSVGGNEPDADASNNLVAPTVTAPLPDLRTSIEVDEDVSVDERFAAVVIVEHVGVASPGVTVTIEVSSDVVIEKAAIGWFSAPCTIVETTATCSLGRMASGAKFVALDLRATQAGAPTISATVGNGQADGIPSNDTDVLSFPVDGPELVDLRFTATSFERVVGPGTSFSEQVHLTNVSAIDATGVVVRMAVPAGTGLTSAMANGGTCTIAGQVATCTLAVLRSGFTTSVTVGLVAPVAEGRHSIIGTATSAVADPKPLDNTHNRTFLVGPPDLAASILEWPATAAVGTPFTFRADIVNRGALEPNAVLRLTSPPGLTIESAAIGYFSRPCAISGSTATCAVGELANTSRFVLVTVRPTQAGPATFTAIAGVGGPDLNPADNTVTATVMVG